MSGLFAGTSLERPVTCEVCERPLADCTCPRGAGGKVVAPADQHLTIAVERRRRGKTVTVITGFDPVASDLAAILKTLKARCAAGGTVADDALEIQGDHRDATRKVLDDLGYRLRVR